MRKHVCIIIMISLLSACGGKSKSTGANSDSKESHDNIYQQQQEANKQFMRHKD